MSNTRPAAGTHGAWAEKGYLQRGIGKGAKEARFKPPRAPNAIEQKGFNMEEVKSTLSRRQFVTLLGTTTAGLTLLGMTGCSGGGNASSASSSAAAAASPSKAARSR